MALSDLSARAAQALGQAAIRRLMDTQTTQPAIQGFGQTGMMGGGTGYNYDQQLGRIAGDMSSAKNPAGVTSLPAFANSSGAAAGAVINGPGNYGNYDGGGSGGSSGGGNDTPQGLPDGEGWLPTAADIFAKNPEAMLAWLTTADDNRNLGIYGMTEPYADYANALFLALNGQDADGGTKEQFTQWLGDYFSDLMTPGGSGIDWRTALGNINNPSAGSPLASYLAIGDPSDQLGNYLRLSSAPINAAFHPLIANAIMKRLAMSGTDFLAQAGRGAVDPFYQWVRTDLPQSGSRLIPGL